MADNRDSFDHVVKTTEQWESRSYEYWIIPRGVLCVELTPDKKTKIKIGEGNKIYSQLPYINSEADLSDYYTKEEIDNILAMLNFVAIPSSEIYPTKEALPQTGNRQGDLRFVRNVGGDPYSYLWFNNKWIQVGGVDLSEYAKKSEVNPRLNALELKAHTHANKSVLDRLTANVIDDSHRHVNKNILDATTAPYTTQDKATLDALAAITVFEGATKTEDGTMGYVPAPLQGQQSYYLKGDGTWAYLAPGDKYKAGEGIYILSGEVISDKFPFEIFPKAATVTQYVIYGTASGVGNAVSGRYEIPIKVSAPGYSDRIQTITVNDPLYDGDYINYQKQVFAHYRTKISNQVEQDPNYSYERAIYSDGRIGYFSPGAYGGSPVVSKPFELTPGASYELHPWDYSGQQYSRFHDGMYINIYDADMNRTRTLYQEHLGNTIIVVADGEKYMRLTMQTRNKPLGYYGYQELYMLYPVETPCQLQQLTLYPGVINTIDVLTTNKPNEIYVEVVPPEDIEPDPEDPLSEYTGIIYNDGVLDITQEDPNALNELTVHFRDDVEKTLTIPTYELPIASDTTLGGIKVGENLAIDPETGVLDATGKVYYPGNGIEFGGETALPTEFNARDFITSLSSVYHGTIVKADTMNAFTLTATDRDCYTESYAGYTFYSFTAEPNTKYRVSWTADSNLPGRTYAFESRGTSIMYSADNSVAKEIVFTTSSTCNALAIRFGVLNTGDSIRYSNINVEKIIETTDTIAAKLGNGLHFDANGAIEADGGSGNYIAGDGIEITADPTHITFDREHVIDLRYYFDTQVDCKLPGFSTTPDRTYTKITNEKTLGALVSRYCTGFANPLTGPFFVSTVQSAVEFGQDYDATTFPAASNTFDYLGLTWYYTDIGSPNFGYGMSYTGGDTPSDMLDHMLRLDTVYPENASLVDIAKDIIDAANLVSTINTVSAKLGNGLQFDANGAIEAIAGTEYAAGDGIQIDPGTSVIDISNIEWQQGKIDDSDGSEAISDVEPYLDCEMFEITSHTSMVTLSGTYDNNIMLLWKPYYYDENENYISTVNTWSTYEDGVQIPINAKYVRFVLTEDETTTLDPNDLAHVEIEYPLEVGKEVITNAGVIDVQVRDRKLIIIKHDHVEEIPIPDPPLATTTTPGIIVVGEDLDIDEDGVLNIADINRLILNAEE